jgi:Ca2+-transporting ATPase
VEKDGSDELFSGSLVVRGRSFIEVSRTGPHSALGRIAGMLEQVDEEPPLLERRLRQFGSRVAGWVIAFCAVLTVLGFAIEGLERGRETFFFAVALAVAAVPEGLPAVMTLALALGVERMAKRKAVVRRLAAVESLGSVTVILTDKTGTLTENRMRVLGVDAVNEDELLHSVVLANDADGEAGDPIDIALMDYAECHGVNATAIRRSRRRLSARDFDSRLKFQRVTVDLGGQAASYLKGAPEVIIKRSLLDEGEKQKWLDRAAESASQGYRILAAARASGETETDIEFLGLIHLWDPLRTEVPDAVRRARLAGIRVIMVTGDHPVTAVAIGRQAGIDASVVVTGEELDKLAEDPPTAGIYARVRPEQKLQLAQVLQHRGEIVGMTGDGVNDAPALKRADVGIAMGRRGSDVAREVSDIVLLDDNFATIVAAIEEGRSIYRNIEKFIRYLLATNLAEVIIVLIGIILSEVFGWRDDRGSLLLPLSAVQILWMNLVTDGLPAVALAVEPPQPALIDSPPRKSSEGLLGAGTGRWILFVGILLASISLVVSYGFGGSQNWQTMLFTSLTFSQIFTALAVRSQRKSILTSELLTDKLLLGACALTILLQLAAVYTPVGQRMLGTRPLQAEELLLCFASAALGLAAIEVQKWFSWR